MVVSPAKKMSSRIGRLSLLKLQVGPAQKKLQVGRCRDTHYPSTTPASFFRAFAAARETPHASCGCLRRPTRPTRRQDAHGECCAAQKNKAICAHASERLAKLEHDACIQSHIYNQLHNPQWTTRQYATRSTTFFNAAMYFTVSKLRKAKKV